MDAGKSDVSWIRLYGQADKERVIDVYRSAMSTAPFNLYAEFVFITDRAFTFF